jgi:hypothetical protein
MPDLAPLEACIEELIAFRDGRLADDHYFTWHGQRRLDDGSLTMPFPDYHEPMDRLWAAFQHAGYPPEPADYVSWMSTKADPSDPTMIRTLDRHELSLCLLAIRRGERFCDGHWASMLAKGALLAAAQRAATLEFGKDA